MYLEDNFVVNNFLGCICFFFVLVRNFEKYKVEIKIGKWNKKYVLGNIVYGDFLIVFGLCL